MAGHPDTHPQLLEGLMGVPGGPAVAGFAAGLMHVVAGAPAQSPPCDMACPFRRVHRSAGRWQGPIGLYER